MPRPLALTILCTCLSMFVSACATKGFVRDQVKATETKVSGQFETQDAKLQETADRAAASREAADAATRRLQGLDARVRDPAFPADRRSQQVPIAPDSVRLLRVRPK